MYTLQIRFKGINEHSDNVNIEEYEVHSHLKELYFGERGNAVETIDMRFDNVTIGNLSDSFKIKYARYIACDKSYDQFTNVKTGNFGTKTDIVLKKSPLCHVLLNFVSLSYGNELELNKDIFKIPVEFFMGKNILNENYKFFWNTMTG